MLSQRLKAPEPKSKFRRGKQGGSARHGEDQEEACAGRPWAVSEGVAIAVGEPNMEIDAEAAEEVDADERLRPGFAQEAPPAIPLGMEERLELSLAALLSSILDWVVVPDRTNIGRRRFCTCNQLRARQENR